MIAPIKDGNQTKLSDHAQRSAHQAIGFLMQQGVENADCISLAAGLVDEDSLPVKIVRDAVAELLSSPQAGRKLLQYGITPGPEPFGPASSAVTSLASSSATTAWKICRCRN